MGLYEKGHHSKALVSAFENYTFLTQVYQKIIIQNKADRSKLMQLPDLALYYEKAVACALELFEVTGKEQYKYEAFEFAERGKAILLSNYVHETQARQFAGIAPEIIQI